MAGISTLYRSHTFMYACGHAPVSVAEQQKQQQQQSEIDTWMSAAMMQQQQELEMDLLDNSS